MSVEARLDRLEQTVERLERRQAVQDSFLRFAMWLTPVLLGIAGIVIGRLL